MIFPETTTKHLPSRDVQIEIMTKCMALNIVKDNTESDQITETYLKSYKHFIYCNQYRCFPNTLLFSRRKLQRRLRIYMLRIYMLRIDVLRIYAPYLYVQLAITSFH
jgi:hypothetical protein